jgi:hypothetical protein
MDWDTAHRLGRRAFFETATLTIRSCPENFLLAVRAARRPGFAAKWIAVPDAAVVREGTTAETIQAVIDKWAFGSTADALAETIGEILPKQRRPNRTSGG